MTGPSSTPVPAEGSDPSARRAAVAACAAALGDRAAADRPLGVRTTYRVGGTAALTAVVGSEADLDAVTAAVAASGVDVVVVGKGSNLLVDDAPFEGLAVVLGEGMDGVEVYGTTVEAGGAAALPVVARRSVAAGLTGFEWAVGVPGSIGGAVRMNAGGHGSDMAATLVRVRVRDLRTGEDGWVPAAALDLRYRSSNIEPHQVVVTAELALAAGDRAEGEAALAEIVRWRRANQPGGQNAGSVFANPAGDSAGRLIDAAGLKGLRVGSAQVSPKHANFIIADPDGDARDVWALMSEIQDRVWAAHGVWLEPETKLVGFRPRQRPAHEEGER